MMVVALAFSFTSCNEAAQTEEVTMENAKFICPMKCAGGFSNEEGANCSGCGMPLASRAEVEAMDQKAATPTDQPVDVTGDQPTEQPAKVEGDGHESHEGHDH